MDKGTLYIVATPIGNLDDMSIRAVEVLKEVDIIACEDTRHSGHLFKKYAISGKLTPYHDHNKVQAAPRLVKQLVEGSDIALVTDSGTPGVSDPAYVLVNKAIENGVTVVPIPGACAAIAAISASGMPSDRFSFEGFLPTKDGKRRKRLDEIKEDPRTLIFYESPYRVMKTLRQIHEQLGDRRCAIARELTKIHEEIIRGTLEELIGQLADVKTRGEYVIIVEGLRASD